MGKKRIASTNETSGDKENKAGKSSKRRVLTSGVLFVNSTYNNTILSVADEKGNIAFSSSSGALGFKGAKKGTPFAAAKVGETLADKANEYGMREVSVVVSELIEHEEYSFHPQTRETLVRNDLGLLRDFFAVILSATLPTA
jgi:small subunit ribosomal protein S11